MSRVREIQIFDSNGGPIINNMGRVPVYQDEKEVRLYDSVGAPVVLEAGRLPTSVTLHDSPALDAFARLRTSSPQTIFDNQFQYNLRPLQFSNSLTGTGAITHLPNESAAELSTGGTASGAKAILQTKRYIRYQPGKSQLIFITATIGEAKANVRQRIGYFSDTDGLFFEQDDTAKKIVVRTSTSGAPVDTAVAQADWNIDTLDGLGPSGMTIDWSKSQIFAIDFEYLGVGRVRFGFVLDGMFVYCHQVLNANNLATVYMSTPNLPIRASIENTGVAASTTVMKQFCMTVMSEGGFQEDLSDSFAIGRGTAALGVTTRRPVLSIRPSVTFNGITNRGHVIFEELELLARTNDCLWELVIGGTLTGASWANVDAGNSIVDYDTSATAITGGVVRNRGWALSALGSAAGRVTGGTVLELFNDFAGTSPDILSLVATSFTGTTNINALLRWREQK